MERDLAAWIDEARQHQHDGELELAAATYRLILQAQPAQVEALTGLAEIFQARGNAVEAVPLLEEGLRVRPIPPVCSRAWATPGMLRDFSSAPSRPIAKPWTGSLAAQVPCGVWGVPRPRSAIMPPRPRACVNSRSSSPITVRGPQPGSILV